MYRTDLRSGEIKILYNGVGLVYETPKVLTEVLPDGSEKVWKKNIDIIQAMNVCGRHKVNGDSVPKGADEIYDYNIYVGGTMLGRGLTLKGLAITYIIRTASSPRDNRGKISHYRGNTVDSSCR